MELEQVKERLQKLNHFDFSLRLFEANYNELLIVLNALHDEKQQLELSGVVNQWKLEDFLCHISFKLHNYVCAAKSLVDHSRVLYSRVYGQDELKFQDYTQEIKTRFDCNELTKFVEFLRNYCQHETTPTIVHSMSFDSRSSEGFVFTVSLDGNSLLQASRIGSLAKKYIQSHGPQIDLRFVMEQYHHQIISFHQWVRQRQSEIHSDDIKRLDIEFEREMKKSALGFVKGKERLLSTKNVKDCFCVVLTQEDYRCLEPYSNNEHLWLDMAIKRVSAYVDIPQELIEILRKKCVTIEPE